MISGQKHYPRIISTSFIIRFRMLSTIFVRNRIFNTGNFDGSKNQLQLLTMSIIHFI